MRFAFLLSLTAFGLFGQSDRPAAVSDIQAFVPDLFWMKRVEPIWPEGARSQGLQGHVQLLVTLDSDGLVTAAEPIAGPAIFRQAAADALKQWQFQPVIRNGRPVPALTTETIVFLIEGKKLTAENMGLKLDEQRAAAERVSELERKFPRSAEQVLADLEQSVAGASAQERAYHLPRLAKAAMKAGDLNKATVYASESLDAGGLSKPVRKNGDGIHDGNMVLGLVALKQGDVPAARQYLLDAGKTTGSPVLGSFGPNMTLAKKLLEAGERDVVLEYFDECRVFWKMGSNQLDGWSAMVRGGGMPEFGPNLLY